MTLPPNAPTGSPLPDGPARTEQNRPEPELKPKPAGLDQGGVPGWARLPAFLTAAAVAAALCVPLSEQVQRWVYAQNIVERAPRDATAEEVRREKEELYSRNLWMDVAALSVVGAVLAAAFGAAAGLCGTGGGGPVQRTARGVAAGLASGAAAGAAGAAFAMPTLNSRMVGDWGDVVGDRQLFPAMVGYAVQMGLIGGAAGFAVRWSVGPPSKRFAVVRGAMVAGVAAGVVCGFSLPFVGVVISSLTTDVVNPRGFHRPVPIGRWDRTLLLLDFGALSALALARASGRPAGASPVRRSDEKSS